MRKTLSSALVLFIALAAQAGATDVVVPKQKIVGAESPIPLGELVILSVTPIEEKVPHLVRSTYEWKVLDYVKGKQVEKKLIGVGDKVFFGSGTRNKTLYVMCIATHLYVVKDGDKVGEVTSRTAVLTADVVLGDDTPPDPGPGPGPGPEPSFPDGKYKLSRWAYDATMAKVEAAERVKGAKALADSFRSVATAIAAGTIASPRDALARTKDNNNAALAGAGANLEKWEAFSVDLQARLFALYQSGTLKSLDDFRVAWLELSAGFAGVTR